MKFRGLSATAMTAAFVVAFAGGFATASAANHAPGKDQESLGMAVEKVELRGSGGTVLVYRGQHGALPMTLYAAQKKAGADQTSDRQIAGGETLWFVDEQEQTLRGCRLVSNANVGGRALRCWSRSFQD